jgi:hypothetical protein
MSPATRRRGVWFITKFQKIQLPPSSRKNCTVTNIMKKLDDSNLQDAFLSWRWRLMVLPTRSLSIYQAIRYYIREGSDLEVRKCTESSIRFLWQPSIKRIRCLRFMVWSELAKQFSDYEMEQSTHYYYYTLIIRNDCVQFLGITLDCKLHFHRHVDSSCWD